MEENLQISQDHIRKYIDFCWEYYKIYKDAQDKLLYWIASVFALVISATGIFGAVNPEKSFGFQFKHIILFHVILLIVWLFYLYKKINADMYSQIGRAGELYLKRCCPDALPSHLPRFFELKSHYFGESSELTAGRSFSKLSGFLIIVTYLVLSLLPILHDSSITGDGIKIAWQPALAFLGFVIFAYLAESLYAKEKKIMQERIASEWEILSCPTK